MKTKGMASKKTRATIPRPYSTAGQVHTLGRGGVTGYLHGPDKEDHMKENLLLSARLLLMVPLVLTVPQQDVCPEHAARLVGLLHCAMLTALQMPMHKFEQSIYTNNGHVLRHGAQSVQYRQLVANCIWITWV